MTREISDFVCFQILQAYYLMINMVLGNLRFKTKNQEPRFAQESLGNLGSWFLVLVRKSQDLFRSPGGILVLGSWVLAENAF